jgi:hypothetical protein
VYACCGRDAGIVLDRLFTVARRGASVASPTRVMALAVEGHLRLMTTPNATLPSYTS